MTLLSPPWDYLVVTASNESQARAYRDQLEIRRRLGFLGRVGGTLVVPDPEGCRIGSGASTVLSLIAILNRESIRLRKGAGSAEAPGDILSNMRILIVHAGGDSRRLPAYGPCGKLFIPAPGESDRAIGKTLFDRQLPIYSELPPNPAGRGQVIVTAGDVFLDFDPAAVSYTEPGLTGLGRWTDPETAARHGVFCPGRGTSVRGFLQKPDFAHMEARKALNRYRQALLDIGVMNLDAETAAALLHLFEARPGRGGTWSWGGPLAAAVASGGAIDFFREFACAMGEEAEWTTYQEAVRNSGSQLNNSTLGSIFQALSGIPFHVRTLSRCFFYHFGTPRQLIRSGRDLERRDRGPGPAGCPVEINNVYGEKGRVAGRDAWVEGCFIDAPVELCGGNVVTGVDVTKDLRLPEGACLDVISGKGPGDAPVWFVRIYGTDDTFKRTMSKAAVFCAQPLRDWLAAMGGEPADLWNGSVPEQERTLWNARLFPCVRRPDGYNDWLWLWDPKNASPEQRRAWRENTRSSLEENAGTADHNLYHDRRLRHRARALLEGLPGIFRPESDFSAKELALVLGNLSPADRSDMIAGSLEAAWKILYDETSGTERLVFSRIIHTLADALLLIAGSGEMEWLDWLRGGIGRLPASLQKDVRKAGIAPEDDSDAESWAHNLKRLAFRNLGETIVPIRDRHKACPKIAIRDDEIIWGRAAARLDLGGGWTDTPPYALEKGGRVLNAAVHLNGQPPIQVYARRCRKPEIRISSIDHGVGLTITRMEDLLDYREPTSGFALAKAALCLMGFSKERARWPKNAHALSDMLQLFGGGIELTTLAAIPSGSGLGTSSIMGAVLVAVIGRLIGRPPDSRELFHKVLQLEQELTTGGGWQDQIGGSVPGVKLISTAPGLVPDPRIHFFPPDVLDPKRNGGLTLLYYTGIRRLAKNILQNVVGRYLDRDRAALATLAELERLPSQIGEALSSKDLPRFGKTIEAAWLLNKRIDPDSSNPVIERILARLAPLIHGAKLLGAGGGGFLLIVCRSERAARAVRRELESNPPNRLARFFDFGISPSGLEVTIC